MHIETIWFVKYFTTNSFLSTFRIVMTPKYSWKLTWMLWTSRRIHGHLETNTILDIYFRCHPRKKVKTWLLICWRPFVSQLKNHSGLIRGRLSISQGPFTICYGASTLSHMPLSRSMCYMCYSLRFLGSINVCICMFLLFKVSTKLNG